MSPRTPRAGACCAHCPDHGFVCGHRPAASRKGAVVTVLLLVLAALTLSASIFPRRRPPSRRRAVAGTRPSRSSVSGRQRPASFAATRRGAWRMPVDPEARPAADVGEARPMPCRSGLPRPVSPGGSPAGLRRLPVPARGGRRPRGASASPRHSKVRPSARPSCSQAPFGIIAFTIPKLLLAPAASRHAAKEISNDLPDALDLLAVTVEAGVGLFGAIARLVECTDGALSDEFSLVLTELRVGESSERALKRMAKPGLICPRGDVVASNLNRSRT